MTSASGRPIQIGDVLIHEDGARGVVVEIGQEGYHGRHVFFVGDIAVQTSYGSYRCGNKYSAWRHVERRDMLPIERWRSWNVRPWKHDEYDELSPDAQLAIDGIMAVMPPHPREDSDDWFRPHCIEDALKQLAEHLQTLHEGLMERVWR